MLYKLLVDNKINFVSQKMFNECRNPKTNKMLPFDFFLTDLNICIEYDGEQHYKKMRFKKSNLEKIQYRDNIKTEFCEKNNIKLIRISYIDIKNIGNIIKSLCNN